MSRSKLTNMRSTEVRKVVLCRLNKFRMPQSKKDAGCEHGFPFRLCGNGLVDQLEQAIGVILYFHVDLEEDKHGQFVRAPWT